MRILILEEDGSVAELERDYLQANGQDLRKFLLLLLKWTEIMPQ